MSTLEKEKTKSKRRRGVILVGRRNLNLFGRGLVEEFVKEKEDHVKSLVCPNLYAYIKAPSPPHVLLLIIDE